MEYYVEYNSGCYRLFIPSGSSPVHTLHFLYIIHLGFIVYHSVRERYKVSIKNIWLKAIFCLVVISYFYTARSLRGIQTWPSIFNLYIHFFTLYPSLNVKGDCKKRKNKLEFSNKTS